MKKVFPFLLMLILATDVHAATTYYSDYGPWSDKTTVPIAAGELVRVRRERWYRYFHSDRISGGYFIEGENPSGYPLQNQEDYHYSVFSSWKNYAPFKTPHREIETREVYQYQTLKRARYIHLENVAGSNGEFHLTEFHVEVAKQPISYQFTCDGCSEDFGSYIQNGKIKEDASYLVNGGRMIVDLGGYYPIDQIEVSLSIFDKVNIPKKFELYFTETPVLENVLLEGRYNTAFSYLFLDQIIPLVFSYQNKKLEVKEFQWNAPLISLVPVSPSFDIRVEQIRQYRYRDKLFRYYREEISFSDYRPAGDSYYANRTEEYVQYYQAQTREKVVLAETMTVTEGDEDLSRMIVDQTVPITIDDRDVDYGRNGVYPLYFHSPFLTMTKQITISIPENNERQYAMQAAEAVRKTALDAIEENKSWSELVQGLTDSFQKIKQEKNQCRLQIREKDAMLTELRHKKIEDENRILALSHVVQNFQCPKAEEEVMPKPTEKADLSISRSGIVFGTLIFLLIGMGLWKSGKKKSNEKKF